jgi:hypothetical protein
MPLKLASYSPYGKPVIDDKSKTLVGFWGAALLVPLLSSAYVLFTVWNYQNTIVSTTSMNFTTICEAVPFTCTSSFGCAVAIQNGAFNSTGDSKSVKSLGKGESLPLTLCPNVNSFVDIVGFNYGAASVECLNAEYSAKSLAEVIPCSSTPTDTLFSYESASDVNKVVYFRRTSSNGATNLRVVVLDTKTLETKEVNSMPSIPYDPSTQCSELVRSFIFGNLVVNIKECMRGDVSFNSRPEGQNYMLLFDSRQQKVMKEYQWTTEIFGATSYTVFFQSQRVKNRLILAYFVPDPGNKAMDRTTWDTNVVRWLHVIQYDDNTGMIKENQVKLSPLPTVGSIEYVETESLSALIVSTIRAKGYDDYRYKIDLSNYVIYPVNPMDTVTYSPVTKYSIDDSDYPGAMKCDPSSTQFCPEICKHEVYSTKQCKKVIYKTHETEARMIKALTDSCSSPLTRSVGSDTSQHGICSSKILKVDGNDPQLAVQSIDFKTTQKQLCPELLIPQLQQLVKPKCSWVTMDRSGSYLIDLSLEWISNQGPGYIELVTASAAVFTIDWSRKSVAPVGSISSIRPLVCKGCGASTINTWPESIHVGSGGSGDISDHSISIRTNKGVIQYLIDDIRSGSVDNYGLLGSREKVPEFSIADAYQLQSYTPLITHYINGTKGVDITAAAPTVVTPVRKQGLIPSFPNSELLRLNLVPLQIVTRETRMGDISTIVGSVVSILGLIFSTVGTMTHTFTKVTNYCCKSKQEKKEEKDRVTMNPLNDAGAVELGKTNYGGKSPSSKKRQS